jgi:hypothetical protein
VGQAGNPIPSQIVAQTFRCARYVRYGAGAPTCCPAARAGGQAHHHPAFAVMLQWTR